jgi:PAS domain S-box-containing protein
VEEPPGRSIGEDLLARAVLAASPDPVWVYGPDLRFIYASPVAAAIGGRRPEDVAGRTWRELGMPPEIMAPFEQLVRRVFETREPVKGEAPEAGGARVWEYILAPAGEPGEPVTAVVATARDVTERKRLLVEEQEARRAAEAARDRLAFIAQAGETLGESLDYRATLRRVAEIAVPRLADWCAVHVVDEHEALEQVAVAHSDPARLELARELERRFPADPETSGTHRIARTGQPELIGDIEPEALAEFARSPEHLDLLRRLGFRSYMGVPLMARGRTLGVLTLIMAESGRTFGRDELELALDVARRAGTAVDNARLFEARSEVARTLQQSLLPPSLPDIPGIELAARYRPAGAGAEVGGDFYDVFATFDGRWAAIVGDVCGKGPAAAALTGVARHTVRATAPARPSPTGVLETLNRVMHRETNGATFFTAAYLLFDPESRMLTLGRGGHPAPLLLRTDGSVRELGTPGPLLGPYLDARFGEDREQLQTGDVVLAYTDGVTDARRDGDVFGDDRLREELGRLAGESAAMVAQTLQEAVTAFTHGEPDDDEALLVVRLVD